MSFPTAVFLDTSVFAGQQYNFSSTALASFVPAANKKGLKFLLPDPTAREVQRQIKERSDEALKVIEEARRKAPFLSKWRYWPQKPDLLSPEWEVRKIAREEWETFLGQLDVVKLGYDGIRIETVMNWYDSVRAPFREGKKRKEFPDAFVIASLSTYAAKTGTYVAVVSEDQDFKAACEHFGSLLYFPSLPRLTELLLLDDAKIAGLRDTVVAGKNVIEVAIIDGPADLIFNHLDDKYSVNDASISSVQVTDVRIVGIGDRECTVTFDAEIDFEADLEWKRWRDDPDEDYDIVYESVFDKAPISGTAKTELNAEKTAITGVTYLSIDDPYIEITNEPYH